jgi:glycosyltransferase involved in cell wall biosynthesis
MISVLMATHNGADTIGRTLQAMSALDAPKDGWEFLVVNNASTDGTEAIVRKWQDRLPLRYLVEARLGKSKAMNTALAQAQGDFIVMTDDDVLPDKDWLTEWRRVADAWPQCSVFGGAVVPEFDDLQPKWQLPQSSFTALYGMTPPRAEGEIEPIDIAGANLAVRGLIINGGFKFDENFLVGTNGLMGEDTDFVKRLWTQGHAVGFAPTARVRHIIHKHQLSWHWIYKRFFRHGRSMFMLEDVRLDESSKRLLFRYPRWRIWRALLSTFRLTIAAFRLDGARILQHSHALANDLGALWQASVLLLRK